MATTFPTTPAGTIAVALEKIHVPANVRDLDLDHVDALAGSIALQGQLVPVLIAPADGEVVDQGFEFELVAGFHRYAAVAKLQHGAIDAVLRGRDEEGDGSEVAAARATENIASCRRRHEAINADRGGMPTNLRSTSGAGRPWRGDVGITDFDDERCALGDLGCASVAASGDQSAPAGCRGARFPRGAVAKMHVTRPRQVPVP
jgi:hypothetical protein